MTIIEKITENNPDAILWDDLDEAVIGFTTDMLQYTIWISYLNAY